MERPASPVVMSRAERYVAGMTPSTIAAEDGVAVSGVHNGLRDIVHRAGDRATLGSAVPQGMEWARRDPETVRRRGIPPAYVTWRGRVTVEMVRWALAVLNAPHEVCECCGRRF